MNTLKLINNLLAKRFLFTRRQQIYNFTSSASTLWPNHQSSDESQIATTTAADKDRATDDLLQTIKLTRNAYELLDVVADKEMTGKHVLQTLRSLYNLQKFGNITIQSSEIVNHPQFEPLCRKLKRHCRTFELTETLDALKFLSYLTVSPDSEILTILLNLIRYQINDLELHQIVFLDFLLSKFEATPTNEPQTRALFNALKIALPILFEINLSLKLDHENVTELIQFLGYAIKSNLNDKTINSLITSLTLHGPSSLTIDQTLSTVINLLDLRVIEYFNYPKLLANCYHNIIKNIDSVRFNDLDLVLNKIIRKVLRTQNYEVFYSELLFDRIAEFLVRTETDFSHVIYVVKKFNRISYINTKLLDYACDLINRDPSLITKARLNSLINFVTAASLANYSVHDRIANFEEILFCNTLFQSDRVELPWLKLTLELLSLECSSTSLIIKIFNETFLTQFLAREYNFLDHLQLLLIYQTITLLHRKDRSEPSYQTTTNGYLNNEHVRRAMIMAYDVVKPELPLKNFLEYLYGGKTFVGTNVKTYYGHVLDHLIVFDRNTNAAVEICRVETNGNESAGGEIYLEQILERYPQDEYKSIAIMTYARSCYALNIPRLKGIFQLQTRTIEALNVAALPLSIHAWTAMPEHEKLPFLTQEINYKLNER